MSKKNQDADTNEYLQRKQKGAAPLKKQNPNDQNHNVRKEALGPNTHR